MNWYQWVQFAVLLAAQILPLVKQTEEIVGAGKGPEKKAVVLAATGMTAVAAGANDEQVAAVTKTARAAVDATVSALNAAGTFKKKTD
jgi:hypothetical protein